MIFLLRGGLVLLLAATLAGCARNEPKTDAHAVHPHEHTAPHGGTAVELGQEAYHLELVRDAAAGTLTAYILDGEMEKFIRVSTPSFEVLATVAGEKRPLTFKAVGNAATGETSGDTAQFDAQADWLKGTAIFDAVLTRLEIRGHQFQNVAFNFPKGNDAH